MKYVLLAAALLVSACGSKPMPPDLASAGHVVNAPPVYGLPATAVFVRDFSLADAGKTVQLYVDGEYAADLETSEKVAIKLPGGDHIFGVALAPTDGHATHTIDDGLVAGETYLYRI